MMNFNDVLKILEENKNEKNLLGMARFGINTSNTYGISMPIIRDLAKKIKKNHSLALELWNTGIHEAKILAALIAEPNKFTPELCDKWVSDFDSWDVCDQVIMNLFDKLPFANLKVFQWAESNEEFTRRAAFALIASMAVHHKKAEDTIFESYYQVIYNYAVDERNFVKKAVNWAVRQIGKRSHYLRGKTLIFLDKLLSDFPDSKSVKWIVNDAVKELNNEKIIARIKR